MLETAIQVDSFIKELKYLVLNTVVKQSKIAKKYETLEIQKDAGLYITMIESGDTWSAFVKFDSDVLLSVGIDPTMINVCMNDKDMIPRALRTKVMNLQKNKIINNYVERNNYYRMLNGEPSVEDEENLDFIYVPPNNYGVPIDVPVHELSLENINYIRGSGILDDLIAKNPTKKYLKFLQPYNISYYSARTANNFELLYAPDSTLESIAYDYKIIYSKARNYFMLGIYNKEYSKLYEYYDEFIGFSIMTMAIQRTISNMYKQGMAREFYDVQLIEYLFNSYSIPYIEELSLSYQIILAKNLNLLLTYKATNKVIYDITSLFDMGNAKIYKYYLVKNHKLDESGNPVFAEKEVLDEITGEPTGEMEPDYEKMYSFHFQKVDLKEKDVVAAISDTSNKVDYTSLTILDPYWVNDAKLYNKLYTTKFNHIITKYMSMDIFVKLYEQMYEACHTIRMIIDNNKDFKRISINASKVSNEPIDLYTLVIFLCAVCAKKFGLSGEIPLKGYQIANVYGFNFHTDLEKIRNDIMKDVDSYALIDDTVLKYINSMGAVTLEDVNKLYQNISNLTKFVTNAMYTTKDKEVYYAYRKLYRSLLIVEDLPEVYTKADGTYASTYRELLESIRPDLVLVLDGLVTEKDMEDIVNHIFLKLSELSTYKYLHSYNESDIMIEAILKLIRFFKSYTVDFVNSGLLYEFDDRYFCGIKCMDNKESIFATIIFDDKSPKIIHGDLIYTLANRIGLKDKININELIKSFIKETLIDKITINHDCSRSKVYQDIYANLYCFDGLNTVTTYKENHMINLNHTISNPQKIYKMDTILDLLFKINKFYVNMSFNEIESLFHKFEEISKSRFNDYIELLHIFKNQDNYFYINNIIKLTYILNTFYTESKLSDKNKLYDILYNVSSSEIEFNKNIKILHSIYKLGYNLLRINELTNLIEFPNPDVSSDIYAKIINVDDILTKNTFNNNESLSLGHSFKIKILSE